MVNALQAVSRANGALTVSSVVNEGQVEVCVEDNGRGIAPEVLERVFDPFYSSRPDGFGLGLFSCRRIAEEHGWRLEAQSQCDEGSKFVLRIPTEAKA